MSLSVYNRRLNYILTKIGRNIVVCRLNYLSPQLIMCWIVTASNKKKKSPFCTVDDVLYGDCLDHTDQNPRKVEHKEHDHLQREGWSLGKKQNTKHNKWYYFFKSKNIKTIEQKKTENLKASDT